MSLKPSASINLGLGGAPEVESPELYSALMPLYNAIRNLLYGLDSYTGNTLIDPSEYSQVNAFGSLLTQKTAVVYRKLSETVSAHQLVNIHSDAGNPRARLAAGPTGRAHGFALASGVSGDTIPICLLGLHQGLSGLTPGAEYYLSSTPGSLTTATTYHRVGFALDANRLWFSPS